jgi:hypothetical protein
MPLRGAYAPMRPEFDPFLFAPVGEEVDGVPLSVLSVLSRLGLDPRDEAARLSHLTKESAADQLASMIARSSDRRWSLSQLRGIAARLIERLPMSTTAAELDRFETGAVPTADSRASPFSVYLAFLEALIVGVIASGLLW